MENIIRNTTEISVMECHIFLFEPDTSRIAGRRKVIYAHIAGRYSAILIAAFVYMAAASYLCANHTLLIMAEAQKIIQKTDA